MILLYGADFCVNLETTPIFVDEGDMLCYGTRNNYVGISYDGKVRLAKIIEATKGFRVGDVLKIDIRELID